MITGRIRFLASTIAPKPEEVKVENEFEEVIDTTDSTTAEVFNTLDATASKTEDWVAKNQKIIFINTYKILIAGDMVDCSHQKINIIRFTPHNFVSDLYTVVTHIIFIRYDAN